MSNWDYYNGSVFGKKCSYGCGETLCGAVVEFKSSPGSLLHIHCALNLALDAAKLKSQGDTIKMRVPQSYLDFIRQIP